MKCPVCCKVNNAMLCPDCGFDSSRDYGKYPTIGPVGKVPSVSALRKQWKNMHTAAEPERPVEQVIPEPKKPTATVSADKPRKKLPWMMVLVCAMVLLLGIGGGMDGKTSGMAGMPSKMNEQPTIYKVGVAIDNYNDSTMNLYRQEIEAYFESMESDKVKYELSFQNVKNDEVTQAAQIDTFIAQDMDVIICNLVQTSSADTIIDKVVAADIPLILFNREPRGETEESYPGIVNNPKVCYVGADPCRSGTCQGEIVLALENKGDMNGDGVVKYVMILGDPENPDAYYRTEYSIKALVDAGLTVECLVEQVGHWEPYEGQEITASALSQYGSEIDVIFCNNDGMALGAAEAIATAGRIVGQDILLLGIDALPECQEMVRNGSMTGTVQCDHIGQAHAVVDAAIDALNGSPLENYYWVDWLKIDAASFT